MSTELDLIRRFLAHDDAVDAASSAAARCTLLDHIRAGSSAAPARRPRRRPRVIRRLRTDILVNLAGALIVLAVAAVFLGLRTDHAPRPVIHHVGHQGPPRLRNIAPSPPPRLPGQMVCNSDLARPGAIAGLGGSRTGVVQINSVTAGGVNESPFAITARGLPVPGPGQVEAVWLIAAVRTSSGGIVLQSGAQPFLLGVVSPNVGAAGHLTVTGRLPESVAGGTYQMLITVQSTRALRRPGHILLQGSVAL